MLNKKKDFTFSTTHSRSKLAKNGIIFQTTLNRVLIAQNAQLYTNSRKKLCASKIQFFSEGPFTKMTIT